MTAPARPLNISIVGAGVGGLTAAIALRRNGHNITIFESSTTTNQLGAGICVQPNNLRILEEYGFRRENVNGCDFDGVVGFDAEKAGDGITRTMHDAPTPEVHDAFFCLRGDLHEELIRLALDTTDPNSPAPKLLLGTKVIHCDPDAGTVDLSNGETISADLVIGADGIHSTIRTSVLGHAFKAPASNISCFRCLFDGRDITQIEELKWLWSGLSGGRVVAKKGNDFVSWFIYPCRGGSIINFVGYYPDSEQDSPDWSSTASLADILATYKDFHPQFLRILDLPLYTTNTSTPPILRWRFRAIPPLPTWIRTRTALVGDAVHATLPLMGQAGAMAMEEAATLACLLPFGTTGEEVPERLKGYEELRKERGEVVGVGSLEQGRVPERRGEYFRARERLAAMIDFDAMKVGREYYEQHFGEGAKACNQSCLN
ncbi:FAD/NAD(P)-binding domain-containing protein [Favolaschia claudopus]|uniref:FAD/NAD(P)-binding domain-containing protein n=1 Tax=Favolaschia claudopus TaxID=2862362 RepID=A0AAW0BIL6_9AGAR